jgi:uncharacterized membrane protein|tara:strand:- start:555 stop:1064 length:510 start_codon:yes stop_codon:yes gene_type:complete
MDANKKLILAFVTLILGAVLIGTIASSAIAVTDKTGVSDETLDISAARVANGDINESYEFTVTNNPTGWKTGDCPLTSVTYGNSSTDYTITTDYLITLATGNLTLKNTSVTVLGTNDTLIDYTYCADDYMNLGWGRTIINLVAGFFAIALLLVSVGLFYSIVKDYKIIN